MDRPPHDDDLVELSRRAIAAATEAGLDAAGIAPATPFAATEATLEDRQRRGLAAGMQFTYRNPARSTDPAAALAGAKALLVGARSYRRQLPSEPASSPGGRQRPRASVARYSWTDAYAPLREALEAGANVLRAAGHRARVLADDNALVDREAAYRAGLGWYGRNTNLLLAGRGSEFVLGAVVTDAPLPTTPAEARLRDGCGACRRCLPACPTGALGPPDGEGGELDARRCLAWLVQDDGVFPREHRIALGDRIYGCDACQDVCPPNLLEIRRRPPPLTAGEPTVDLLALLDEPDDDRLLATYGRWYIARRQARHLRRNALVVLANVADGRDPGVGRTLARSLDRAATPDPLVRAHAVWAAARLGRDDLLAASGCHEDGDPLVQDELGTLPPPREA